MGKKEAFFSREHLFTFDGRRNRKAFIMVDLFWTAFSVVLSAFDGIVMIVLTSLLLAYPDFCNISKRFHDFGKPTSWAIVYCVFINVVSLVLNITAEPDVKDYSLYYGRLAVVVLVFAMSLVLYCKKGTAGPNPFGPDPLGKGEEGKGEE